MAEWVTLGKSKGKGRMIWVQFESEISACRTKDWKLCDIHFCARAVRSRVKEEEAKPRKGKEALFGPLLFAVGPVVRPLCTRTSCSTEGDEGDLSEALQQRGKQDCKSYPIAWDTCSHYIMITD